MEIKKTCYAFAVTAFLLSNTASAIECYINNRSPSIAQGNSKTIGSKCDRYGNTGPITITSNAPAGITVSASPNPMTGKTSNLNFAVARSVPTGAKQFNVTFMAGSERSIQPMTIYVTKGTGGTSGSGGSGTSSGGGSGGSTSSSGGTSGSGGAPVLGSYSISASPTQSIQQAQSGSLPVTINRTSFTNTVALSVTGLPVGVTASFSPASTTSSASTLTLSVASGVNPSTYNLTLRGTSGSTVQTSPLTLTVTPQPANFSISTPSAATIQRGRSTSVNLNVNRTNMTENISFVLSGLPSGVTGACPATTGNSTTCSLSCESAAPTGTVSVLAQASSTDMTRSATFPLTVSVPPPMPTNTGLRAFPEAEGFGAYVTGGRGGRVCKVTNMNATGAGSLQACLDLEEPATIVFTVGAGVIDKSLECHTGNKTIAGQTAPGGIIAREYIMDNVYEKNPNCGNIIVRHMRFRSGADERRGATLLGDSLRTDGVHNIMLDHLSLARASDENWQNSRSYNITLQNSIIAEVYGEHIKWGGNLHNYSASDTYTFHDAAGNPAVLSKNLDNISLHHNLWIRVGGRYPEFSCEENTADGNISRSNCSGKRLKVELSNNMIWDAGVDPVWYNRCTGLNEGDSCARTAPSFFVDMNWVGNQMIARRGSENPMMSPDLINEDRNHVYYEDNYRDFGNFELVNFMTNPSLDERFDYPSITYTPSMSLGDYMKSNVGAFPRDPMDQRLISYLNMDVNQSPVFSNSGARINDTYHTLTQPCASPLDITHDTDDDGMPDSWERSHGLNVGVDDHNGTDLSSDNYTNIEMFLNEVGNRVVVEGPQAICDYQ